MLHLTCPYCQHTLEEEDFSYAGEALIKRPSDPKSLTDEQWGDYVFMRSNPKGRHLEQWNHAFGCRKFFLVERNTIDNTITGIWPMSETANLRAKRQEQSATPSSSDASNISSQKDA